MQIAIRHPHLVNKLVLGSATYKRNGMQPGFFEGMQQATLHHMPQQLQEAFLKVNPDPQGLQAMFERDVARMLAFTDIPDESIKAIEAPALVINADREVIRAEHALELSHMLPNAHLLITPGGHGDYIGEICVADKEGKLPELVINVMEEFLGHGWLSTKS